MPADAFGYSHAMRWLLALGVVGLVGCGAADGRHMVTARHIDESSGAPNVSKVVDLGDLSAIPAMGAISTRASDGVFVVGELVLIEGEDFGKQPTVSIGGRPARNLGRTKNGGIVARIPAEVDDGQIKVEVSHGNGSGYKEIELTRYLALAGPTSVHLIASGAHPSVRHQFEVAGATGLAFSHDGQALYIAGPKRRSLQVVKVSAKDRPTSSNRIVIGENAINRLATRMGVPMLAVLGNDGVRLFDTRVPTAISQLPMVKIDSGVTAGVFSPDGQFLAVISNVDNWVRLIQVGDTMTPATLVSKLELMVGDPVPLLRDLAFAPEGDELWVVSGNSMASTVAGVRPTQITRLALQDGTLTELSSAQIAKASGPRFMAVSLQQAIMAATAVRSTKRRATLVLSTVPSAMVGASTDNQDRSGQILDFDLEGNAKVLVDGPGVYSRSLLSHDQQWVYAATRQAGRIGVTSVAASGGKPSFLELADDKDADALEPLPLAIAP